MRCLISLIIISSIFIASVLLTRTGHGYNNLFNFVVVPVFASVIFLNFFQSIIVIAVSLLLCLGFIFLGVGLNSVFQACAFILSAGVSALVLRRAAADLIKVKVKVLNVLKEEYRSLHSLNNEAKNQKLHLEKTVHDITSLYQAPKKMISSVTLEDLLTCMKSSIVGYFDFSKCKIIMFVFKEKEPKIDFVYNLPEEKDQKDKLSGYEEVLCAFMKDTRSPFIIDRDSSMLPPEALSLDDSIKTFIAIPLVAGNRLNGIFVIENPSLDDMARFIILGHQFAIVLERIRLYGLVQELAITDGLTDVFVRRYFLQRLEEEAERARHFNGKLAFLMIDIDHFKQCNDKFGHLVGDVVLREAAGIMKNNLREIDIIGRYGGEEFCIVLPDTSREGAFIVAERLRKAMESSSITAYDENINVRISIGLAVFPDDADGISQLIDKADRMLYRAKESGRNRVIIYGEKN
jgi:diguanylate cyclase (GGDEF)-like protein